MIADTLNENKPNETESTESPGNTGTHPGNTIPGTMRYPMLYDRLWWVWMYLLEDTLYGNTASSSPENTGFDSVPNPDTDIGTDTDRNFDADPDTDTEAGADTDTGIDTALKLWKYFYLPDPDPDSLSDLPDNLFPGSLSRQNETAV